MVLDVVLMRTELAHGLYPARLAVVVYARWHLVFSSEMSEGSSQVC